MNRLRQPKLPQPFRTTIGYDDIRRSPLSKPVRNV
jgi:hypothetical protein